MAGLRLRLRIAPGHQFKSLAIENLPFYIYGREELPVALCEQCLAHADAILIRPVAQEETWHELLTSDAGAALTFYRDVFKWRPTSAIDRGLLEALRQALPRLRSVQPYLMASINRCRRSIPRNGAWLALVEAERACVALHAGGRWRSVQNAKGAWLDLLDRERHRAEGEVPELALVAGAEIPEEARGWNIRMLPGGLAH